MPIKKTFSSRLHRAVSRANAKKRLMIIEMPEEYDTSPHWLLWLALVSFIGLTITAVWALADTGGNLQTYLPFL